MFTLSVRKCDGGGGLKSFFLAVVIWMMGSVTLVLFVTGWTFNELLNKAGVVFLPVGVVVLIVVIFIGGNVTFDCVVLGFVCLRVVFVAVVVVGTVGFQVLKSMSDNASKLFFSSRTL